MQDDSLAEIYFIFKKISFLFLSYGT